MVRLTVDNGKTRLKRRTFKKKDVAGVLKHEKTDETILLLKKGRFRKKTWVIVMESRDYVIEALNYTPW